MSVSVLIPFRGDGGQRDRIWAWMKRRYELTLPDYELVVSDDGATDGPFNEGRAWNRAADLASGDILILGEAETAFNAHEIALAVQDVRDRARWCVADSYFMLRESDSDMLLRMPPDVRIATGDDFAPLHSWRRSSVSSPVIVPRHAFELVGGYDERWVGWGWLDKALAAALTTLYAPLERFPGAAFHLWHPRGPSRDANPELSRRYLAAEGDREAMLALIGER